MDETGSGFDLNALANGIVGLFGKAIDAKAQQREAQQLFDQQRLYGVDQFGRPYALGQPAPLTMLGSPLMVVGVGVAAITLLVLALKN